MDNFKEEWLLRIYRIQVDAVKCVQIEYISIWSWMSSPMMGWLYPIWNGIQAWILERSGKSG